jgi:enterochelin esterase-like enzyme
MQCSNLMSDVTTASGYSNGDRASLMIIYNDDESVGNRLSFSPELRAGRLTPPGVYEI